MKSTLIKEISTFQQEAVASWNTGIKKNSKLMIPPVSLRDEITTKGFGMAVIELLCLVGILKEEQIDETRSKWVLGDNWSEKVMILCVDGLSLDRFRCFEKKLSNVKMSFSSSFEQTIIFQRALSRVVDINGSLHMAFHMLQCIYTVFQTLLKWAQNIVDWKRLIPTKVSDSFDLARQLVNLLLGEVERYLFGLQ